MASIGIIGGGAFGTALACLTHRSGHDVLLWAREPEVVDAINHDGVNPYFLPNTPLPSGMRATSELDESACGSDIILMAEPAQHVRAVAASMRASLRTATPVLSCSKGIERGSCHLMPEVHAAMLPQAVIAVLSGSSIAREIANDLPCGVLLALHHLPPLAQAR